MRFHIGKMIAIAAGFFVGAPASAIVFEHKASVWFCPSSSGVHARCTSNHSGGEAGGD